MPIEINYFAWEQWKAEHKEFACVHKFIDDGFDKRITGGYRVALLMLKLGSHNWCNYELLSESPDKPITTILKITQLSDFMVQWNVEKAQQEASNRLHQSFRSLPNPTPAIVDIFADGGYDDMNSYYLQLSEQYESKIFDDGWGYSNFSFKNIDDYRLWRSLRTKIFDLCDELTGNQNQRYVRVPFLCALCVLRGSKNT